MHVAWDCDSAEGAPISAPIGEAAFADGSRRSIYRTAANIPAGLLGWKWSADAFSGGGGAAAVEEDGLPEEAGRRMARLCEQQPQQRLTRPANGADTSGGALRYHADGSTSTAAAATSESGE